MKTSTIPAQVTTVEDKIAGNLNFTQVILLIIALVVGMGIYVIVPSQLKFTIYKVVGIILEFIFFGTLALRVKERLVLNWCVLLLTFFLRPHVYVYNKNSTYLRK